MCSGGSDDDSSDNNVAGNPDLKTSKRPKMRPAKVEYKKIANPAEEFNSDNGGKEAYIQHQLNRAGFKNNKGVVDGFGNPVGNVVSGKYASTRDNASDNHDNSGKYNTAYSTAQAEWLKGQSGASGVSPALIAAGLGNNGLALKDGFSIENAEFGTEKATAKQQAKYAKMLGLAMQENYLGTKTRAFPGATFDDPYGTAMGGTLKNTYLGSNLTGKQQRDQFAAIAQGFDKSFGRKLSVDAAGNVGTTNWGQRVGAGFGNVVEGLVLGGIAGPVGSMFATGTNYNVQDNYGANVPGFQGRTSTASFDYGGALGGILGDFAAGKAAPYVGQKIYDGTGSVGTATIGAVATGVGLTEGIGSYVGNKMDAITTPGIMSSTTSDPWETQRPTEPESGGFGANISGNQENNSVAPTAPAVSPSISTLQNTGLSDTSGDVAAGSPDFDWQAWLLANAKKANPNSAQPTGLDGSPTISASNNPLFSAQPDMNGVRYLQKGGTNRNYGTAMMQPMNSMQQSSSKRRSGLNDKRIGVVIG